MTKTVSSNEMALLAGFSRQYLVKIEKAGFVKRTARDRWDVVPTFQGIVQYLRSEARSSTKIAAESRVRAARAREIEVRTALRLHSLCEVEEAVAVVEDIVGMTLSELSGLPAKATRDLTLRRHLDDLISSARNRVAARCELQATSLRSTGEAATGHIAGQAQTA